MSKPTSSWTRRQYSSSFELEAEQLVPYNDNKNSNHNDGWDDWDIDSATTGNGSNERDSLYSNDKARSGNYSFSSSSNNHNNKPLPSHCPSFPKSRMRQWVWGVVGIVLVAVLFHLNVSQHLPRPVIVTLTSQHDDHDHDNQTKTIKLWMHQHAWQPSEWHSHKRRKQESSSQDTDSSSSSWQAWFSAATTNQSAIIPKSQPQKSTPSNSGSLWFGKSKNNNNKATAGGSVPTTTRTTTTTYRNGKRSSHKYNNYYNASRIKGPSFLQRKPPYSIRTGSSLSTLNGGTMADNKNHSDSDNTSPYNYSLPPPPPKTNVSKHFVERWCDLTARGGKEIEWYPGSHEHHHANSQQSSRHTSTTNHHYDHSWQRRAPAFLIPGAKYSGVSALAHVLSQHPQIAAPLGSQNLKFFMNANFRRYVTTTETTQVYAARQRLYAHHHFYPTPLLQRDPNVVSFDATGGYLLYSTVTPRRIFCVAPWVKLIIVLTNPIERLVHHYQAVLRQGLMQHKVSMRQWIDNDLRLLRHLGLLNTTREYHGSQAEDVAWYEYQSKSVARGTGSPFGRSLYEIQLRQWLQAVLAIGKKPSDVVLLVRASDFRQNPTGYLKRILQFVGVDSNVSQAIPTPEQWQDEILPQSNFAEPSRALQQEFNLTADYKRELHQLFQPYMQRLPAVLKHFGLRWAAPAD